MGRKRIWGEEEDGGRKRIGGKRMGGRKRMGGGGRGFGGGGRQTERQTSKYLPVLYCTVVFCCTVNTVHMWY
jgi:hypothetical protein